MNRHTFPLGRIMGIPLELDPSWFLALALVTWTLATSYYPGEFASWPAVEYWILGTVTAAMMFTCVVLHELGHSAVALRYKIPVRRITLFIFGGVAEIGGEPPSAAAEFRIAITGPAVSFALAVLFALLRVVVAPSEPMFALTEYLAYINASLALFNLIPGFPLDGGRVLRAIIWGANHNLRRATVIAANVGRGIAFMFVMFGAWQVLDGKFADGLWIAFVGWFLDSAASAQIQQQASQDFLQGHKVWQAMDRDYAEIPAEASLQDLLDVRILASGQRTFVVKRDGHVAGLLTLSQFKEIPRDRWANVTVAEAMTPIARVKQVAPADDLRHAVAEMDRDGVNQLPVIENGQIRGMLSRGDVLGYLRTMHEIGAAKGAW